MIREEADFILPENAYGEEAAYTEILNDTLCQMMDLFSFQIYPSLKPRELLFFVCLFVLTFYLF